MNNRPDRNYRAYCLPLVSRADHLYRINPLLSYSFLGRFFFAVVSSGLRDLVEYGWRVVSWTICHARWLVSRGRLGGFILRI